MFRRFRYNNYNFRKFNFTQRYSKKHKVKIVITEDETYSIDVPSDVEKTILAMEKDELNKLY